MGDTNEFHIELSELSCYLFIYLFSKIGFYILLWMEMRQVHTVTEDWDPLGKASPWECSWSPAERALWCRRPPPRLLNACGGSSQPPPQWEHPLRSVLLSVSAHACRVCDLVLGIPTLSHIYGCHLQVASQFNEYPEIPHIKHIFLPMRVGISASFLDRKTYHQ